MQSLSGFSGYLVTTLPPWSDRAEYIIHGVVKCQGKESQGAVSLNTSFHF